MGDSIDQEERVEKLLDFFTKAFIREDVCETDISLDISCLLC